MRLAVLALVAARAAAFSLRVLHVNDHHSHIEASAYSFLTTIEEDIAYGGWALMVSAFAALAGDGENVLKVHAGDAITGTSYYSLFDGAPDAAVSPSGVAANARGFARAAVEGNPRRSAHRNPSRRS